MTDIGFMVRSANPVPDDSQQLTDDELVAVLLLAQQRSGNMDAKELTRPVEPDRKTNIVVVDRCGSIRRSDRGRGSGGAAHPTDVRRRTCDADTHH